ncbi:MAG: TauD/TfdA family dioxygenase [Proteobacteria bacterium]|nr:TauD/TfdA family dioxygenase [Pseudomonadota bacterium]
MTSLSIQPTDGPVGAFVSGIDLADAPDPATAAALRTALGKHGVLFFRDQTLTPEAHIAFAQTLAPIVINRFFTPVDGYPNIAEVRKEADQKTNIGGAWHADHSYDQIPAMGSILVAKELPPEGGDTLFAGMYAAHDSLPADIRDRIAGLRALHSSRHVFGADADHRKDPDVDTGDRYHNARAATQDVWHPMVIRHPLSGRKSLYVNPDFTVQIDGLPQAESDALLALLFEHAKRPEHIYRFEWEPGSIALWDNRATWHMALNDYHGHRRLMHRITLAGVGLEG